MLTIGLTGMIGSGKSIVSDFFAALGAQIIDADVVARDVVSSGSEALLKIKEHFGSHIVDNFGTLKRQQLRQLILEQPQQRQWLEQLLHPYIIEAMQHKIATAQSAYCIAVIPLIDKAASYFHLNRILVVDTLEALQISRIQARDGMQSEQILLMLQAQLSRQQYLQLADDVIVNDGSLETLKLQVMKLHEFYLGLAKQQL